MKQSVVLPAVFMLACAPVWAAQPEQKVEQALQSKVNVARQAQEVKSPVVSFTLNWEWDGRYVEEYSFRNRKTPGKPLRFGIEKGSVETKTTTCLGAVVTGAKAITHKSCFQAPNKKEKEAFQLRSLTLTLKNGRSLLVKAQAVQHSGEFGFVSLPADFVQGIQLAQIRMLPKGKTLEDVYGENFSALRLSYMLKRAGMTRRTHVRRYKNYPSRMFIAVTPGEPLFLQGQLVALGCVTPATVWQKIKSGGRNFVWTPFSFQNGAAKLIK